MKITITINCDNAAFGDTAAGEHDAEVQRLLRELADDPTWVYSGDEYFSLRDMNGNTCGKVTVTE